MESELIWGQVPAKPRPLLREQARAQALLDQADVRIGGSRPWDLQVHHPDTLSRFLAYGSLGLGESYMDGWWDCPQIDEFIARALRARLDAQVGSPGLWLAVLRSKLTNLQSVARAWQVGREHYDLGNELY